MIDRLVATVAATVSLVTGLACSQAVPPNAEMSAKWKDKSMFDISLKTLDGKDANLSEYAGKVVLVVNVASQCGFTGQYTGLQKTYDKYKDKGFVVLGVPSGDFGGQEFDSAQEIREFCDTRYKVTFPMFDKCRVKSGAGQSELFEFLGTKTGELPGWNFGKYLVGRDGAPVKFYASNVAPESKTMVEAIEKALAAPVPAAKPAQDGAKAAPAEAAKKAE
ncbi:MAG: glutathione peroxidase [Planctomycetaceae bacterium]|nr:glutathione peroxidase [Planctomycetaceae bacterium]